MIEWKEVKLKDAGCKFLSGYAFKSEDYSDTGIPLIKIGNIQNKIVSIDEHGTFIKADLITDKLSKYLLCNEDILIAMTGQGSVGRVGKLQLADKQKALLNQRVGKFITAKSDVNIKYLYYVLASPTYQEYLFNTGSGSGQPNLSPELILETEVTLPPLPEQERIAEVLSSLDDKIDFLQRQNKTLEEMAETLFRQRFDINNEDINKRGFLGDFFKDTIGGEWGKDKKDIDHRVEVKCIRGTDIGDLFDGIPKPPVRYVKENKFEKCKLIDGDIVIEISGGTEDQSTGRCHYFNKNLIEMLGGKVVFSNFCRLLRPKNNDYTFFLHVYINLIYQRGDFFNLENGTSGIKNLDLKSFLFHEKFYLPDEADLINYNKTVTPFFEKLTKNLIHIQQLEILRDTLLPKLMSGQIICSN